MSRYLLFLLMMIALISCSAPQDNDKTPLDTDAPEEPEDTKEPNGMGCQPTFNAQIGAACAWVQSESCTFPEGSCECYPHPHCGGAMPPPDQPGDPGTYSCMPNEPGYIKADGCPFSPPQNAYACTESGKHCEYPGGCFWNGITLADCDGSKWTITAPEMIAPPP